MVLIGALVAGTALAVLSPLVRPGGADARGDAPADRRAELEARKEAKYREIRDAELDFRTGKLSEADYRVLDRSLRAEAIGILREIDGLAGGEGSPASD